MKMQFDDNDREPLIKKIALRRRTAPKNFSDFVCHWDRGSRIAR